ncbi:hypothetical protein HQ29_10000 [Porphyromonas canoris]|uniref:hypothetical protein n=1 Tax=Porphyromonas canoris TaxID=36875 RepID=UPI00051D9886|nr:hypothetical protein [Porphyromonas canoris]KGL50854.1 hypothetical protein HQ29_10000 [Porphyromonas canoris]
MSNIIRKKGHIIQSHRFNKAISRIQKFSGSIPPPTQLSPVDTDGGFLGLFDHKVTGAELNKVTQGINKSFIAYNQQIISVIKEFNEIYTAFEALDKDYIQGIIISVKSAEAASKQAKEASDKANKAIKDTGRTIEALSSSISKIANIRNTLTEEINYLKQSVLRIEKVIGLDDSSKKHLEKINTIWKDINDHTTCLQELDSKFVSLSSSISYIDNLKIEGQKHSKSIQDQNFKIDNLIESIKKLEVSGKEMQVAVEKNKENLLLVIEDLSKKISLNIQESVKALGAKDDELNIGIQNLSRNLESSKKDFLDSVASLSNQTKKNFEQINDEFKLKIEKQVTDLEKLRKENNESINNLKLEFDRLLAQMNSDAEEIRSKLDNNISSLSHKIDSNVNSFKSQLLEITADNTHKHYKLSKRLDIAYIIGGSASVITITHILLRLLNIL